jgi:hypothetical protein
MSHARDGMTDSFRFARQNEAARRRTLRVRRMEQFMANG